MNTKAMVPLVLAVVLGLTAAFLVRSAMSHRSAVPAGPGNLVTVVVAKLDADPGHALTAEDLGTAKVPAEAAPGQVFSDPAQLVGRVAVIPLVKGQTLFETLLAPAGTGSGLQSLIPPGMRAVTLEVTEDSGVGGMLEPGSRVDVVSCLHDDKGKQQVARTVLQYIKVSAVGRNIAPSHPAPGQPVPPPSSNVTLLCTPKQAQTLELATNSGRPWLILRATRDGVEVPLESTTMAELQGNANASAEPATAAATTKPAADPVAGLADPVPATPVASAAVAVAAVPATVNQTVTVITGGVVSHMVVTVPNPDAAVVAPLDQGYAFPSDK